MFQSCRDFISNSVGLLPKLKQWHSFWFKLSTALSHRHHVTNSFTRPWQIVHRRKKYYHVLNVLGVCMCVIRFSILSDPESHVTCADLEKKNNRLMRYLAHKKCNVHVHANASGISTKNNMPHLCWRDIINYFTPPYLRLWSTNTHTRLW